MHKDNPLETHSTAWSRAFEWRKSAKGRSWMPDKEDPLRMRGYTELIMGNLDDKLRKKLDSALRRGYALENRTQLPALLCLVRDHCPVAKVPIGYIGKTELNLFLPTAEDAADLARELQAQTTMTDAFDGSKLIARGSWQDWHCIHVYASRKDATGRCPHLVSTFKEMRPAIDEWMAANAAVREDIARWAADDATTIRIAFDSHRDWRKQ